MQLPILERVRIASPCPMQWDDMSPVGDGGRIRNCEECRLNVYDFSAMTAEEVEDLVRTHEGQRLCATYFQRADGTALLRDCPVGLAAIRAKTARLATRVACAAGVVLSGVILMGMKSTGTSRLAQREPFARLITFLRPSRPVPLPRLAGDISCPPPQKPSPLVPTTSAR
jgi:hypothetical protein